MLGGLFDLSQEQKRYLDYAKFAPLIVSQSSLYITNDALTSIILTYALAYISIPYIYIKNFSKERQVNAFFFDEFRNRQKQINIGISCFIGSMGVCMCIFQCYYYFQYKLLMNMELPIQHTTIYLVTLGVIFVLGNPILEEWYWRIFLIKTHRDDDRANQTKIYIAYAFYNFITIYSYGSLRMACVLSCTLQSFMKTQQYVLKKFGFITASILHLGVNLAMYLFFLDILHNQKINSVNSQTGLPNSIKIFNN